MKVNRSAVNVNLQMRKVNINLFRESSAGLFPLRVMMFRLLRIQPLAEFAEGSNCVRPDTILF